MPEVLEIRAGDALPKEAGGKALGLHDAVCAGLTVPEAWVVLPGAGEDDVRALAAAVEVRGIDSLAVRSSAAGEDGRHASFAGIHETLLGVKPAGLVEAVRRVAGSPLSPRAAAYRREMGLPPPAGPGAVVVQAMVAAERAGVAFGAGEGNDSVVIEAVRGLGERLVQGLESPEVWETSRREGATGVRLRRSAAQESALVADASGTRTVRLTAGERRAPVLAEGDVRRIAEGVRRLQASAGTALDVEWCARGADLLFLQARPRTRPLEALPPGQVWSRANFRDVLPDLTSALTRSFVRSALARAMEDYYANFGILADGSVPLIECVHGRLVSNETVLCSLLDRLGVPRSLADVSLGGGEGGADRFEPMDVRRQLRHPILLLRSLSIVLKAPSRARRFLAELRCRAEEVRSLDLERLDDRELTRLIEDVLGAVGRGFAASALRVVAALQGVQYRLSGLLRRLPRPGATVTRLVAPELDTVSGRMTRDLTELALEFRRHPDGGRFFEGLPDERPGPGSARPDLPPGLRERVEEWMARHGHRGPWESELMSPRYREDWRVFAGVLGPLVTAEREPESPADRKERIRAESEAAWAEVRRVAGPLRRWMVRGGVRKLARLLELREELRCGTIACVFTFREVNREAGRRLAARGQLSRSEDMWHLSMDELRRALREEGFDAAGAVARERGRRAAWRRIEVPNRFRSEEVARFRYRPRATEAPAFRLQGTGIGPGLAEGRARLLETPEQGAVLEPGEILVAHTTDPGWTPLFARAGGVLVEMGGTLSHAGIVAREFGIPCVSNVDGVMHRIRDGQVLRIDGTNGVVEALAPSPPRPA